MTLRFLGGRRLQTQTLIVAALAVAWAFSIPSAAASPVSEEGCQEMALTSHSYVVNGKSYRQIPPNLAPGTQVHVVFNVAAFCKTRTLSFVAYDAPPGFALQGQTVNNYQTGQFSGNGNMMTVTVPHCLYQIELVMGDVIHKFDPYNGITYHGLGRFIDGAIGGELPCTPPTTTTPIPTFPTTVSFVLGTLGALGAAFLVMRRRS
jgi:hypothetical protein